MPRKPIRRATRAKTSREEAEIAAKIQRVLLRKPQAARDIMSLDKVERAYLVATLVLLRGNQSMTARRLGIGRTTMRRRIHALKLRAMLKEIDRERRAARKR